MRRKNSFIAIIIAALVAAFVIGCSESYPGITYDQPNDVEGNGESSDRIPVMVTVNTPQVHFTTRGSGPLDNNNDNWEWKMKNTTLYVYAFLTNNKYYKGDVDYREFAKLRENDEENDIQYCLVDGYLDDGGNSDLNGFVHGKRVKIDGESNSNNVIAEVLTWDSSDYIPYYSNLHQDYKYNFFIYHLDDAKVNNAVRSKEAVSLDIEIDGTQDIMSGVASIPKNFGSDILDDILSSGSNTENDYKELIDDLCKDQNFVYSTKLGHRGVHPNFKIKHELVNFKFNVVKGDDSENSLTVTDIILKNCKTKASFTVAANDTSSVGLVFSEDKTDLHLPEIREDNQYTSTHQTSLKEYSVEDLNKNQPKPVGAGLLLAPDTLYKLKIECKEILEDGKEKTYSPEYNLFLNKGGVLFSAGSTYYVNISIYGTQEISLTSSSMQWMRGDTISIGDENEQF